MGATRSTSLRGYRASLPRAETRECSNEVTAPCAATGTGATRETNNAALRRSAAHPACRPPSLIGLRRARLVCSGRAGLGCRNVVMLNKPTNNPSAQVGLACGLGRLVTAPFYKRNVVTLNKPTNISGARGQLRRVPPGPPTASVRGGRRLRPRPPPP